MEKKNKPQIQVRYNETSSLFSSQFLINSTDEDVTIGFSSGYLSEPGSKDTHLPIHTRISMTMQGAKRLHSLLSKVIRQEEQRHQQQPVPETAKAKLPKM